MNISACRAPVFDCKIRDSWTIGPPPQCRLSRFACIISQKQLLSPRAMATQDRFPLHHYAKGDKLGSGGFGEIRRYDLNKAVDGTEGMPGAVAVKKFHTQNEDAVSVKGHEILFALRHDNLVRILGLLRDDTRVKVVLELCDGSLEDLLAERGGIPVAEAAGPVRQVMEGLWHLHQQDIMHRDIKPANVLIMLPHGYNAFSAAPTSQLVLKLSDYDFVRRFARTAEGDTVSMTVAGTERYMAPEVRRALLEGTASSRYTESADVYSAGVLCYELVGGELHALPDNAEDVPGAMGRDEAMGDDDAFRDFVLSQVKMEKRERPTVQQLLEHRFLKD